MQTLNSRLRALRTLVEIILSTSRVFLSACCKARFAGNSAAIAKKRKAAAAAEEQPNVKIISTRVLTTLALCAALLSACALHPQVLPITPQLDVSAAAQRGDGRTIALDAIDGRADKVVGYRDANDLSSAITTAPETMRVIKREVESAYGQLGFRVVPQGEEADITLQVRLTELGYTRQQGTVVNNIRTGATIEATSVMRGKTVTGTYRDGQGKEMVLKPNLEDNANLMNKHLSEALARMVADPRLTTE